MKIIIKYLDKIQEFENQNTIVIGNNDSCNFFIEELGILYFLSKE